MTTDIHTHMDLSKRDICAPYTNRALVESKQCSFGTTNRYFQEKKMRREHRGLSWQRLHSLPSLQAPFIAINDGNEWSLQIIATAYATEWPRHIGCLIFIGLFSQKNFIISVSFAKRYHLQVSFTQPRAIGVGILVLRIVRVSGILFSPNFSQIGCLNCQLSNRTSQTSNLARSNVWFESDFSPDRTSDLQNVWDVRSRQIERRRRPISKKVGKIIKSECSRNVILYQTPKNTMDILCIFDAAKDKSPMCPQKRIMCPQKRIMCPQKRSSMRISANVHTHALI